MYNSIQNVYAAFAGYRKPHDFPACQCCLTVEEKKTLLRIKREELSADDLMTYAADVFLTMGTVQDFKYFLPRILELSVTDQFTWPDPEVALAKLHLGEWEQWPETERAPVQQLLD